MVDNFQPQLLSNQRNALWSLTRVGLFRHDSECYSSNAPPDCRTNLENDLLGKQTFLTSWLNEAKPSKMDSNIVVK
jgi:hypothetical protein